MVRPFLLWLLAEKYPSTRKELAAAIAYYTSG